MVNIIYVISSMKLCYGFAMDLFMCIRLLKIIFYFDIYLFVNIFTYRHGITEPSAVRNVNLWSRFQKFVVEKM